jgi:hypothetical protein
MPSLSGLNPSFNLKTKLAVLVVFAPKYSAVNALLFVSAYPTLPNLKLSSKLPTNEALSIMSQRGAPCQKALVFCLKKEIKVCIKFSRMP